MSTRTHAKEKHMGKRIWQVGAENDCVYIEAGDRLEADRIFRANMGDVPTAMLTWTEIDAIPEGEEALPDPDAP